MTLFSVGFSSWSITNNISDTATGTLTTDTVLPTPDDVSQLVTIDEVKCFEYNAQGIIHRNDQKVISSIDKTATVTATFTLSPKDIQNYCDLHHITSLSLETTLTYSGTTSTTNGLFGYCLAQTDLDATSYKLTDDITYVLSSTEESKSITMDFTFTIAQYAEFYDAINNDNFEFKVSASLIAYIETPMNGV